jgi:uncharacterized protein Yka (UPF0111/DUF47 family)
MVTQFSDTATSVAGTVVAALLVVGLGALVRFLWNVRDSLRDIGRQVDHHRDEEPTLYDLMTESVEHSAAAAKSAEELNATLGQHLEDDDRRFNEIQTKGDERYETVIETVLDLRDKVQDLTATVEGTT